MAAAELRQPAEIRKSLACIVEREWRNKPEAQITRSFLPVLNRALL
jgi:uncharacterized membrane-anchored protein